MSTDRSNSEDPFLTVAEVAELLKLNQQTVRNWIDQGSLPAIRMGRRVRIKRSDFERVLEQNYNPGTVSPAAPIGPSAEDFWGGTPVGLAEPGLAFDGHGLAEPELAGRPAETGIVSDDETLASAEAASKAGEPDA